MYLDIKGVWSAWTHSSPKPSLTHSSLPSQPSDMVLGLMMTSHAEGDRGTGTLPHFYSGAHLTGRGSSGFVRKFTDSHFSSLPTSHTAPLIPPRIRAQLTDSVLHMGYFVSICFPKGVFLALLFFHSHSLAQTFTEVLLISG